MAIVTDAVAIAGWVRDALDGSECGGSIQRTGVGGPQIQINSKHRQTFGVQRLLHYVDQHCSGEIAMVEVVTTDEQARHHYLVSSLMEEAIRSSQLEGATTSRRVAKELLRTGTPPKLNNTCTTANTGYFASVLGVAIQESTTVWVYNDQTVDG